MNKSKRFYVTSSTLTILISLYQATILNLAYYKQVWQKIHIVSFMDILFLCTMPLVIFCVIWGVLNALVFPHLVKLASLLLILIGAPLTYFMFTFSIVIDRDMLQNVLETHQAESMALITPPLIFYVLFLGILPASLVLWVKVKPVSNWLYFVLRRVLSIVAAVIIVLLIAFFFYKNYAAFMRNNRIVIKYLLPSNYISAIYNYYDYLKNSQLPFVTIGQDVHKTAAASQQDKKTLMIFVLGETARAQNFSLGGYDKKTNPRLSQRDIAYFEQTSSCGTATAHSLPCLFSNMPRNEYDAKLASRQSNVLDMLQSAGIDVLWRENDGGCKGVCERVAHHDLTDLYLKKSDLCHGGYCYDDILFTGLDNHINQLNSDGLIVLHTIGSHGPTYYLRYPDEFKTFTPTCNTNEINQCDKTSLVNTYDNTIVYTDYIIDKAIALAQEYSDKYNTAVMYVSDHGESLGENGIYLHSMPYAIASREQTHVPFLIWLSDGFKKQHALDWRCFKQQAVTGTFSHDNIFHSLLGLFQLGTKEYQPKLDIFQSCQTARNVNGQNQ